MAADQHPCKSGMRMACNMQLQRCVAMSLGINLRYIKYLHIPSRDTRVSLVPRLCARCSFVRTCAWVHEICIGQKLNTDVHEHRPSILHIAHRKTHLLFPAKGGQRASFQFRLLPFLCCTAASTPALLSPAARLCDPLSANT